MGVCKLSSQVIESSSLVTIPSPSFTLSSVQLLSHIWLFCDPMNCSMPGFPVCHQLLELAQIMSIELVMPSNHLILCRPLLLLPSIFPSIKVFSNESVLHIRWPKYWSFSISPSNEYSRLISFRIDWFDLLSVQGTLKSLLQHHGSKASILRPSTIFIVHHSHPYMTIGKTIALTRWTLAEECSPRLCLLPRGFSHIWSSFLVIAL